MEQFGDQDSVGSKKRKMTRRVSRFASGYLCRKSLTIIKRVFFRGKSKTWRASEPSRQSHGLVFVRNARIGRMDVEYAAVDNRRHRRTRKLIPIEWRVAAL